MKFLLTSYWRCLNFKCPSFDNYEYRYHIQNRNTLYILVIKVMHTTVKYMYNYKFELQICIQNNTYIS